jgi:phenylacetic acid degradation operon negative regulatory protein
MTEIKLDAKTTPKRLILSLLSSPGFKDVSVNYLIEWGKIFDIDPPTTRVAVGRLAKQGLITSVSRGNYIIGPNAESVAKTARSWIDAEDKVGPWSGQWIVAHTAHLGRTNKTAVRARERSFRLNGFACALPGLWCRPANFKESLLQTQERLTSMGLEPQTVFMNCDAFSGIELDALYLLWPTKRIESEYRQVMKKMIASRVSVQRLNINDAVRETFTVGESVIRQINADPLLPDEMINTELRRDLVKQMKEYNELGRVVWEQFHSELRS